MDLGRLRADRTLAYVAPLVAFMAVGGGLGILTGSFESFFRNHEDLPWWRRYPEQWIYPLQTVTGGACLAFWWRHYELKWSGWKVGVGAVMGAIGIGLWILPTQTYEWWGMSGEPEGWKKWLGILPRRDGFNPGVFESAGAWWTATTLRFLRAVVVVAFVEELLWRGFLMRFVLKPDGDYWKVRFGTPSWRSYVIVTVLVVLIHSRPDWAAAFVWGSLVYLVAVWTRSLLACIVMHGVANFLMGWYALAYGKYGLW